MMSKKKIAAALAGAVIAAVSMASCADTSYICKTDDYSVNAGVYIYYVISQINNQAYSYYYTNGAASENIVEEAYGDGTMTVGEYSQEAAYQSCKELVLANIKFEELGLELSQDDLDSIDAAVDSYWDEDYYESMGISKDSIREIQKGGVMLDKIFLAYYGENGIEEVTQNDIDQHLSDNYVRFKLISIQKSEDNPDAAQTMAEEYARAAEEKSFDEVIKDYQDSQESSDDESSDGTQTADGDEQDEQEEDDNNIFVNKNSSSYSSNEVVKYIDGTMINDQISTYEDDYYCYVIQKLDVLDYPKYSSDNHDSLLSEMKSEEFQQKLEGWTDEYPVLRNDKSFSRYSAERIYEDYTEYQEEQSNS